MSELIQLENLQKTIKEIRILKVVSMPIGFENKARKISREQIFVVGQMNVLVRIKMIIDKYL